MAGNNTPPFNTLKWPETILHHFLKLYITCYQYPPQTENGKGDSFSGRMRNFAPLGRGLRAYNGLKDVKEADAKVEQVYSTRGDYQVTRPCQGPRRGRGWGAL